jgi:uncharacterized protein
VSLSTSRVTRIGLLGATGGTGKRVIELAAGRSVELKVLVRDPAKLPPAAVAAAVVRGDARDPAAAAAVLDGVDAVISCLGMQDVSQPATDLSDAMGVVAEAMQRAGVRRLVAIAAAGVLIHPAGGYRSEHGHPAYLQHVAREHRRMFEALDAGALDWTLLCPVGLVDDIAMGHARWSIEDLPAGSSVTGRWDLAAAALDLLGDPSTVRKRVGIVSDRPVDRPGL